MNHIFTLYQLIFLYLFPKMYQPTSAVATSVPVSLNINNINNINTQGACSEFGATKNAPPLSKLPVEWSTNFCNCCSDVEICCLTLWCPCITFGRVAEIIDKGSTCSSCGYSGTLYTLMCCMFGFGVFYSCYNRSRLRDQYGLEGNCHRDCTKHCCCSAYCSLCQEYRELQNRGFNMLIGWRQNVEQQTRGITTAPAVISGMKR